MILWTYVIFTVTLLCGFGFVSLAIASDTDRPLIWNVSRSGQNGVAIQTGVQLQNEFAPKVGIDTSFVPNKTGAMNAATMPIKIWARMKLAGIEDGAGNPLTVNADVNPVLGDGGVSLEASRSWDITSDLEMASTSVVQAGNSNGEGRGLSASQRVDFTMPDWQASFYSETTVDSVDKVPTASVGLDKSVFQNVNLSASFADVLAGPKPAFHAGYQHRW